MTTLHTKRASAIPEAQIRALRSATRGTMIAPQDPEYEGARKVWNGMVDRHPALILRCEDTQDVVAGVNFARQNRLPLAIRGGGHNVAGFGTCDGGLVIDLSLLKGVKIDSRNKSARAQGGLTWGEFDTATQEHGLATTGGLVSTTGIAGFTLGGGIGWLMRKHGLAADNLLAAEIVSARGERLRISDDEHPDLFWGLRGGGGNFGIVTEFTYRLHAVGPNIFGGAVFYPLARAGALLRLYRDWVKGLPDELTSMVAFLTAPPAPFVPEPLQGSLMVSVALCHVGDMDKGADLVQPLRDFGPPAIDLLGPQPYVALQGMFDAAAPPGMQNYWKSSYLPSLSDSAIAVLEHHAQRMKSPLSAIHVQHLEGAVARVDPDATSFGYRQAPFVLNVIGTWPDAAENEEQIAWVRGTWAAMREHSMDGAFLNFLGADEASRVTAAYGAAKYKRLRELKQEWDPTNLFHINQNIAP
jgi:FAD/FMN-containing dehydrogenase